MNEERIEELLRNAPGVIAPAGLLQELQRDIRLPRLDASRANRFDSRPWLRRWLPALSFAAILFACLVAIGMQTNILSDLQRENATLRAATQNLGQLRAENEEYQRLQAQNQELERLRKDNAELHRLQNEVAKLRAQIQDLEKLRAENQKLYGQIQGQQSASGIPPDNESDANKADEESMKCILNLKQIGISARLWGGDNNNIYATDFISMTNELGTPLRLQCPSDKSRTVKTWADVAAGNVSYRMLAPGIEEQFPAAVYVQCPIHGHVCLVDGSVLKGGPELQKHLKVIDGKLMVVP